MPRLCRWLSVNLWLFGGCVKERSEVTLCILGSAIHQKPINNEREKRRKKEKKPG
jgi:hypothetical protein